MLPNFSSGDEWITSMERKETERLLQGLQEFANLGDSIAEFRSFSTQWPDFFPVSFRHMEEPTKNLAWSEDFHPLVLAFSNMLCCVWRTGSERTLALLLGVGRDAHNLMNRRLTPETLDQILGGPTVALCDAMKRIPGEYFADLPEVYPDWQRGEFQYEPKNNFQKAIHLLWRQSWRAKCCRRCRKYFVADKPAQMYCSVKCFSAEKKERGRAWWRKSGEVWRKSRKPKEGKGKKLKPDRSKYGDKK